MEISRIRTFVDLLFHAVLCARIAADQSQNNFIGITFTIDENSPIDTEVGRVPFRNTELKINSTDKLRFTLQDTSYFSFDDQVPGRLVVRGPLDRDADRNLCTVPGWPETCSWSGVIFVSDGTIMSIRVVIRDINDNVPHWPNEDQNPRPELRIKIAENNAPGTLVDLPLAVDPDFGNNSIVGYQLIQNTQTQDESLFQLKFHRISNSVTCALVVLEPLDRELRAEHRLAVAAIDGDGKRGFADLLVEVTDENDNVPVFRSSPSSNKHAGEFTIWLDEGLSNGTILRGSPVAYDEDNGEHGRIVYSFALTTTNAVRQRFRIDQKTGELSTLAILNCDLGDPCKYRFTIVAKDHGSPPLSSTTSVTVHVKDINDNAPKITIMPSEIREDGSLTLEEDAPKGTIIATVTVYDPDTAKNGEFECQLQKTSMARLIRLKKIGQLSLYQIRSSEIVDREKLARLKVMFRCKDKGSPMLSSSALLTVHIGDINDNSPKFSRQQYSFQIAENNAIGQAVGKVEAKDADDGLNAQVNYSIQWINAESFRPFSIDSNGILRAMYNLDREHISEYHFQVKAQDRGNQPLSSYTEVKVSVKDVNDCPPRFIQVSYHFSIQEDAYHAQNLGAIVGHVEAEDCDTDVNSNVTYVMQTENVPFQIKASGNLVVTGPIDREVNSQFLLHITAYGSPELQTMDGSATTEVIVDVNDINDNPPLFSRPPFGIGGNQVRLSMYERPGYLLATAEATDRDSGPNGMVHYAIADTLFSDLFMIDSKSGELRLREEISTIGLRQINLPLLAVDGGVIPRTSTASVTVIISDLSPSMDNSASAFNQTTMNKARSDYLLVVMGIGALLICMIIVGIVFFTIRIISSDTEKLGQVGGIQSYRNGEKNTLCPRNCLWWRFRRSTRSRRLFNSFGGSIPPSEINDTFVSAVNYGLIHGAEHSHHPNTVPEDFGTCLPGIIHPRVQMCYSPAVVDDLSDGKNRRLSTRVRAIPDFPDLSIYNLPPQPYFQ